MRHGPGRYRSPRVVLDPRRPHPPSAPRVLAGVLAGLALTLGPGTSLAAAPAAPAADIARAIGGLGAPGFLWGRIAVEEESPEGPWTPLAGVEVTLYPYAPGVEAELEQIRQRARDSGAGYDTAVARLRERLEAYAGQIEAAAKEVVPGLAAGGGVVRRRLTDPAGLFVFDDLPSGEWLLLALRLTEYTGPRARRDPRRSGSPGGETFLSRSQTPAKEAEVWLARVRVGPGERVRVWLTDRGRFMVGPLR